MSTILRELSLQKNRPASRSWYLIPWLSTIDKKSDGVNRESAEVTKWGFLEMYFSGPMILFEKLHCPPPETRILAATSWE
jgi:hypothetical protein